MVASFFQSLISLMLFARVAFRPPNASDVVQWLDGTERQVGFFSGNDEILLDSVPSCFSQANCTVKGQYHIEVGATSYLFNVANSSNPAVLCGSVLNAGGTLQFFTRGVSNVLDIVTFGSWDGDGEVSFVINGTSIDCFIDGIQLGTTQTIVDITDNVEFPFDRFYIGSRGNVDQPITGLHWNFSIGETGQTPLLIPINDGSGNRVKDSQGNEVGTLNDEPETNFWDRKYLEDRSLEGRTITGNYGQKVVSTGELILNNTDPTNTYLPFPFGVALTRQEIEDLLYYLFEYVYHTPPPDLSTLSTKDLFRLVVYVSTVSLTQEQQDALNEYVGREVTASEPLMFNDEGDQITNDEGTPLTGGPN